MKKITIIRIVTLSVLTYVGYDMFQLHHQEKLWGHRPLLLLLSIWGCFVLFRAWMTERKGKKYNWRLMGISTLSGGLLSISFPGLLPVPIFMFIGFVPLLFIEKELSLRKEKGRGRLVFRYAFNSFWVFNILTTWWVSNASLPPGIFANIANALLMATAFWLFHKTKKAIPKLAHAPLVTYWMSYEYLHLNWELSWPWLMLGNSFAQVPWWVQWYEYTGAFGGTVLILLVNILAFSIIEHYNKTGNWAILKIIKLGALMVLPLGLSLYMYSNYEEKGETVEVVVIQPNYEPHFEKFSPKVSVREQTTHFLKLAATEVTNSTDYLVFPETSFKNSIVDTGFNTNKALNQVRQFLSNYDHLTFVSGASVYHIFEEGEKLTPYARVRKRKQGPPFVWESYNAGIEFSMNSPEVSLHKKSKLVPGAESFPFRNVLFFLKPLVDMLGGSTGLAMQSKPIVFDKGVAKVAPIICYESIYGEYFANFMKGRKGANLAFVMTNDGWWDDTPGYRQHLHFSRLRAIETRRDVARAANTGTSAFINQRGDILEATSYNEAIALKEEMHKNDIITFYTAWGDMLARIALLTTIIFLLNAVVKTRLKRKEDAEK